MNTFRIKSHKRKIAKLNHEIAQAKRWLKDKDISEFRRGLIVDLMQRSHADLAMHKIQLGLASVK